MIQPSIWDSPTSLAWCAGLYEGEGWCGSVRQTGREHLRYLNMRIGMTDRDVIERAHSLVGLGIVRGPIYGAKAHYKPQCDVFLEAEDQT